MSRQYPGGFISKNAPVVSPTSASGMWSMDQVGNYVAAGTWSGSQSPSSPAVGTVSLSTITASGSNWLITAAVPYTAPVDNGGAVITGYVATSSPGNLTGTIAQAGPGTITVVGIQPDVLYTFTVTATSAGGSSAPSASSNAVITSAAPTGIVASVSLITASTASVSYVAPTTVTGATVSSYTATSLPGGITGTLAQAGSGTITVSGLSVGTTYTFTVTATYSNGATAVSSASNSVIAAIAPGAPTIGTATISGTTATVPFNAPASNGGTAITSYTATSSPDGFTGTLAQAGNGSITVFGLTAGTAYTFTVTATNAVGTSSASSASNSITAVRLSGSWTTPALMNNSSVSSTMTSVTVNSSGLFVAVGGSNYSTSTNGSTWTTPAAMNGSISAASMTSVTVNSSGLFVAVGYSGGLPVYATSSNGSTWTTPAAMNNSNVNAYMNSVTVNSSGLFVAVGRSLNNYPVYATSTNGSTWTTPALMNGSTSVALMFAVTVNSSGLFVAVGYTGGPTNCHLYATSSNGSTWSTPAAMGSTTSAYMFGVTVNASGLFVAVGYSSGSGVYATSANGSTWTTPAQMNGSNLAYMKSVTVNSNGLFVAVGYNNSNYPMSATSSDGSTWTTPAEMNNSSVIAYMQSVTVNSNGLFVAVGYDSGNKPLFAASIGVANAPTIGTATVLLTTATVPFTAPTNNGGSTITGYTATSSPGNLTGTISQAGSGSISVSGLTKGTAYTFTVKATNAIGTSSASAASNSITALGVADAPTIGTATVLLTTATVPFTAPTNNGGSAITVYTATSSPGNLTGTISQAGSGSITVSGLTKNTAYTFTVKATNAIGTSSASAASNSITALGVADAPTIGTATVLLTTATVPYTAPTNNGGSAITVYTATSSSGGFTGTISQAGSGSISVSGLTKGTAYTFTVTATNGIGTSSASSASNLITAQGVPNAPTIGTATVLLTTATVPYTAPTNNGGSTITVYTATSSPGGFTGTLARDTDGTITVNGLSVGTTYTFTVTATNAIGTGSASSASNSITTANVPDAPTIGTATVLLTTATVPFTAPSNNGSTITSYTATSSPGGVTGTLAQAGSGSITVSGLSTDTLYTFTVTATNAIGTSSASTASNSIITDYIIGQALGGGFFAGKINVSGTKYNLIVAPKATGGGGVLPWFFDGTYNQPTTGMTSAINGPTNSASLAALGSLFYAATFCETRTIGDYSDWYLPAKNELEVLYYNLKPTTTANDTASGSNANAVSPEPLSTNYTSGSPAQTSSGIGFRTGETEALDGGNYWSSTEVDSPTAWVQRFGNGEQFAAGRQFSCFVRAVRRVLVRGLPDAPIIGTVTISYTTATVPFTAPASNGGSEITSYTATSSPGNLTGTINQAGSGSITVSGLTGSIAYTFTVKATNAISTGSASAASNSVTAFVTVPGTPTVGTVTISYTTATVPFTAPTNNGASTITSYTATSSPGNLTGTINQTGSGSITVTGLTAGTAYTFTVKATNAVGTSSASSASNSVTATPSIPGAPTIGTVTVSSTATAYGGGFTATVPFTAPLYIGDSAITSYTATSSPGNLTGTLNQAGNGSITVSGLLYSTAYTFTVKATNSSGTGAASNASNSVSAPTADTTPNTFSIPNLGSAAYNVNGQSVASNSAYYNTIDFVVSGLSPYAKVPAYINVTSSPSHLHSLLFYAADYTNADVPPQFQLLGVTSPTYNGSADGSYFYANASGQIPLYFGFKPMILQPVTNVVINDPGTYTWSMNLYVNGTSHPFTFTLTI